MSESKTRALRDRALAATAKRRWADALKSYQALEYLEPREALWSLKCAEVLRQLGRTPDAVAAYL